MNSANSETTNSTMNSQNDQYPRRLALKFCQRRRLSGEIAMRWPSGGTPSPIGVCAVVSGTAMMVRSSSSHLPRLEVDARIDQGVGQIGDEVHRQPDQRKNEQRGEHHGIVAVEHALEAEQAEAIK